MLEEVQREAVLSLTQDLLAARAAGRARLVAPHTTFPTSPAHQFK